MEPDLSSRNQDVVIGYIFAASIGMVRLQWVLTTYNTVDTIPYSQFEQLVAQGNVSEVAIGQDTIQCKLKDKLADGKSAFVTARARAILEGRRADLDAGVALLIAREEEFAPLCPAAAQ